VTIPAKQNEVATYPIAVVTGSTNSDVATSFVDYVTGSQGEATLKQFGFGPPPSSG